MNNVILTILHRYDYPIIEPFIESLKASGFSGELVVFASSETSTSTKKKLKKNGAIVIEYQTKYPFIDGYEEELKDIASTISINNYRFIFYLKYLKDHIGQYKNVMMTDIRDVVFQKDIFGQILENKLYFFLEDASNTIGSSKLNHQWSLSANGPEITEQILNENISCAGIVIGETVLTINYLKYMQARMKHRSDLQWGFDQGIHNAYVHTMHDQHAMIIPNTEALILTLEACRTFKQDSSGLLTNGANEPYCVIHQWDRFGDLISQFKRKYIGPRLIQILKRLSYIILP